MKSRASATANIGWNSPLDVLISSKKASPNLKKLKEKGPSTLLDLVWIPPLKIHQTPHIKPFTEIRPRNFFKGSGKVIHLEIKPSFGKKGPHRLLLYQAFAVLKDDHSPETIALRWFNVYPNQKKQIESFDRLTFLGEVNEFKSQKQIVNPKIIDPLNPIDPYIIDYPTINKVPGSYIKKLIDLIPAHLWNTIPQTMEISSERNHEINHMHLSDAFKIIHGKIPPEKFSASKKSKAESRLIFEEFLIDQLKIQTRRKYIKQKKAPTLSLASDELDLILKNLPFQLTSDQLKVLAQIADDLGSSHPMMRMVQGDVGCGKTVVAYLSSMIAIKSCFQVALMCPTETLAKQHLESFKSFNPNLRTEILLGSTKSKDKKIILSNLMNGEIDLIIGTHSLFQDSVKFKNLGLAIIDEQHKFGVEQRLRLNSKGEGTHCLIMSATPIPRTLSLVQYGDLDISVIRNMPEGRKGIKTRITEVSNYPKYLDFIKNRLALGEQAYFVFPVIEESEKHELLNVNESFKKYQKVFQQFQTAMLHGQLSSEEKEIVINRFKDNQIQILLSTSVIEVGINVPNATMMCIYHPERFGLSSLHQLRGRVGRGEKPGFCFLILDKEAGPEIKHRLEVLEQHLDGFVIAEEDLKLRGEGDLFGVDQSGNDSTKRIANLVTHSHLLEAVIMELENIKKNHPEILDPILERLAKDQKILDTI